MAIIDVETTQGVVKVEIEGDTPTQQESDAIRNQFFSAPDKTNETFEDLLNETKGSGQQDQAQQIEQNFDTESGIQDAGLRSALSVAENAAEEDNILNAQGFSSSDYTRDNRGRLALTPSGASKVGVQTDKNILIDEEGFSRNDFSDLAGMLPELGFGVTGAVKGAAIGSAIAPGIGTLLGGAIGAFIGGGAGSLVEEAGEGLFGVSEQTASDIATDALVEGSFAAGGELLFGLPILAFKAIAPSGKKFIKEASEEELRITGKAIERGLQPTKAQLKMSPIAAKFEQLSESVIGTSPRTQKIAVAMQTEMAALNKFIKEGAEEGSNKSAGQLFIDFESAFGKELAKKQVAASQSIMNAIKESADAVTGSLQTSKTLDDDLFNFVQNSFKNHELNMSQQWATINEVIETSIGTGKILPTSILKDVADVAETKFASLAGGNLSRAEGQLGMDLVADLRALGDKASFTDIYQLRRKLWDTRNAPKTPDELAQKELIDGSMNLTEVWKDATIKLNNMLLTSNIDSLTKEITKELGEGAFSKIRIASELLPGARQQFREGAKLYDNISASISTKELVEKMRGADFKLTRPSDITGIASKLIGNGGKATGLKNFKTALNDDVAYNGVKDQIGKEWLKGSISRSGFDSIDPTKFKPDEFIKSLDELGETGVELFGIAKYNQLKTLGTRFENLKITQLDDDLIQKAIDANLGDGVVNSLRSAVEIAEQASNLRNANVFSKIRQNKLDPIEAADAVTASGVTRGDIRAIMNYFKDSPEELKTIRGFFVENMVDGVGAATNADSMKKLATNILKQDKNKKLDVIFPNEGVTAGTAENIREFGQILNKISSNIPKGDLVAAGILANVFNNVGRIAKMFAVGQLFTGKKAIKQISDAAKKLDGKDPTPQQQRLFLEAVSDAFSSALPQTASGLIEEGISDTKKQLQAVAKNSGINNVTSQLTNNMQNSIKSIQPPASNTSIGGIDITQPGVGASLGINPKDQAIARRRNTLSPLSVNKEQYGELFQQ